MPDPQNPYQLSGQDRDDLTQIRALLPEGDPRRDKIDTLIGPEPPKETHWFDPGTEKGSGFWNRAKEFGKGGVATIYNTVMHPQNTLAAMGQSILASGISPEGMYPTTAATGRPQDTENNQAAQQQGQQGQIETAQFMKEHPSYTAGGVVIPAIVTHAITKGGPAVLRTGGKILSGPGEIPKLIATTEEANKDIALKNQQKATAHQEDIQNALHETKGKEIQRQVDVAKKAQDIQTQDQADAAAAKAKQTAAEQKVAAANEKKLTAADAKTTSDQEDFFRKQAEHKQQSAQIEQENARLIEEHQKATQAQQELQARLNQTERSAKVDLGSVEKRVHADANQMYEDFKPQIAKVEADPETVAEIHDEAADAIDFAAGEPPLLAKFKKALNGGSALTYGDLDAFRSAIGRALAKGNLASNTYYIYKNIMEPRILDEMTRIADEHGLSEQADAARAAWRSWAEAFRDRSSPFRKILGSPEEHGLLAAMRGKQSYLERLRSFGDDGSALADNIERSLNDAQKGKVVYSAYGGIKVPEPKAPTLAEVKPFTEEPPTPAQAKPVPAPKPAPLQLTSGSPLERAEQSVPQPNRANFPDRPPEIPSKKINLTDLQEAKKRGLQKTAEFAKRRGTWIASGVLGYKMLSNILREHWSEVPKDIAEGGIAVGGVTLLSRMLENPTVARLLTNPTPSEIASIPPSLRGDLPQIIEVAQRKGLSVNPALILAARNQNQSSSNAQPQQ